MKNNFGYWLGRKIRAFKEWNHPTFLKYTYIILFLLTTYQLRLWLYAVFGAVISLIGIVLLADFMHENNAITQRRNILNELKEIKKLQENDCIKENLTGSHNGTGNGC
ncbi:TPA: hypothetical protein PW494_002258 [Mannheimia haemolytica]|nr:hypothetical protein [Mannheimia haemolytica]